MTHTCIRKIIAILCILTIFALAYIVVCNRTQKYSTTIPVQGVFSNSSGKSDSMHEQNTVHFSLLDTGKYYIMTADGFVKESGQCYIDENGFGHLEACKNDQTYSSEKGYFICTDDNRFLLISCGGEIIYMRQIDEGGRAPSSETECPK